MNEPTQLPAGRVSAENGYFYTGVTVSAEVAASLKAAYSVPYIIVGGYAPASPQEVVHAAALRHGLPDIRGFYGFDFRTNEFLREVDADKGEPDAWPSRKLDDILKAAGVP